MIVSSYGRFGASAPPKYNQAQIDSLTSMMNDVIGRLRRAVLLVRARVATERTAEFFMAAMLPLGLAFTSTDQAKKSVLAAMDNMDRIIARLDGPSRKEVFAGTELPEQWLKGATAVQEGIDGQLKAFKEDSTASGISKALENAWDDLKNLANAGKSALMPVLFGGGALLAAYFLFPLFLARRRVA